MKTVMRSILLAGLGAALLAMPGLAATMQCAPSQVIATTFPSGTTYTAAADGIVIGVANTDIAQLTLAGCDQVGVAGPTLIGRLVGANMNVTTDQPIPMLIAPSQYYVPAYLIVKDCSASLTTAKGAVYDAAAKGGNILFGSSTQVFTACTGTGTAESLSAVSTGYGVVDGATANPPILALTTAQGAAATANVYLYGYLVGQ